MTLLLTSSQLEELVDRPAVTRAVSDMLLAIAQEQACQPAPTSMYTSGSDGRYVLMSAVADTSGTAAVKLLADIPENASRGLPTQRSVILVIDKRDGEPIGILHGGVPTRVRTAAASAVATDALAREDSRSLGLIGAGALAREHVEALRTVRAFDELVVWSRTRERAEALIESVDWKGRVTVAATAQAACEAADVICTLTPSVEPIVRGDWLRAGQHLNVVGARPRPNEREVDTEAMSRASVWVDDRATAETKSGDLLLAVEEGALRIADVVGTLGEVLAGHVRGRQDREEITLFDSVGIGAQDLAVADVLIRRARARGIGFDIDLRS